MKSNITLKLDRDLLRKVRILAAEKDTSVSALLTEQLAKAVRDREGYEKAKRRALARLKRGYNLGFTPPASRDELHER
jgi:predicted transcriptional regulator